MTTSPIDLVTIADVAQWGNFPSAVAVSPDLNMANIIQEAITGFSDFVMWQTGRKPGYFTGDSGDYTVFTETRDGNDSSSMGVLNGPMNEILSVQINNQVIPQSLGWNQFGYYIEQDDSFIGLRGGEGFASYAGFPFAGARGFFTRGKGNVLLNYKGGYITTPPDLFLKSLRAIKVLVDKRLREDEQGRTTPQTGSVSTYRTFPYDKDIIWTIYEYRRTILSFGFGG